MAVVAFPARSGAESSGETVVAAAERFTDGIRVATTRASYAETLARLADAAGARPVATLAPEDYAYVMSRWDTAAAATWNRHLSALAAFTAWAQRQDLLDTDPGRRLDRRKPTRHAGRAIPYSRLEKLFTADEHNLRERVLWRQLYETAARAEELLSLDVDDLDLERRRAMVTSKGGAIEYVHWQTGTARLLPRLLQLPAGGRRTTGPLFLATRAAPASGRRAPAAADIDPSTGRGRLSYPRAEYLFKQATKKIDPHKKGWTLHQLRHSALTHLAENGRTAPELQAKSRHQHLASLGAYVQLGTETAARVTAQTDPHTRRRSGRA